MTMSENVSMQEASQKRDWKRFLPWVAAAAAVGVGAEWSGLTNFIDDDNEHIFEVAAIDLHNDEDRYLDTDGDGLADMTIEKDSMFNLPRSGDFVDTAPVDGEAADTAADEAADTAADEAADTAAADEAVDTAAADEAADTAAADEAADTAAAEGEAADTAPAEDGAADAVPVASEVITAVSTQLDGSNDEGPVSMVVDRSAPAFNEVQVVLGDLDENGTIDADEIYSKNVTPTLRSNGYTLSIDPDTTNGIESILTADGVDLTDLEEGYTVNLLNNGDIVHSQEDAFLIDNVAPEVTHDAIDSANNEIASLADLGLDLGDATEASITIDGETYYASYSDNGTLEGWKTNLADDDEQPISLSDITPNGVTSVDVTATDAAGNTTTETINGFNLVDEAVSVAGFRYEGGENLSNIVVSNIDSDVKPDGVEMVFATTINADNKPNIITSKTIALEFDEDAGTYIVPADADFAGTNTDQGVWIKVTDDNGNESYSQVNEIIK